MMGFDAFFRNVTGYAPFPFQRRFAKAPSLPQLVCVPTGLGKTAMAVVGWLWRRFGGNEELRAATPRRLAYLEALLRAADMRASKAADERAAAGRGAEAIRG